jgi:hypothetical protein
MRGWRDFAEEITTGQLRPSGGFEVIGRGPVIPDDFLITDFK